MLRARYIAVVIMLVALPPFLHAATVAAEDLLPRIVQHTQGWGQLGIDTAVSAPGATPARLRIGDSEYDSGLGLHAPGETWLALERQFSRFDAEVGIQRQANNAGSAQLKILADGALVFDSGIMREADAATAVSIPVAGVHYLKFEIGDGGDGITCDAVDIVNVRLQPDPDATTDTAKQPVDIAPFARLLSWSPYVKDGTHATRTEEFPVRDLFPGDPMMPLGDEAYSVPLVEHPHLDLGKGSIGLEWLEQRRLRHAAVEFAGPAPSPAGAAMEFWSITPVFDGTPGVSRWQGHWEHLDADIIAKANHWTVEIPQPARGWQRMKTMKLRWIFPRDAASHPIRRLTANSDSAWSDSEITLRTLKPVAGQEATVTVYNGAFTGSEEAPSARTWNMAEPLTVAVRYADDMPWTRAERTVLRLATPSDSFGIAVTDILRSGCVFVEQAGLVATPTNAQQNAEAAVAAAQEKLTVLEEVRTLPDQTFAQALEHVHRPEADFGPTLLSLAHGNTKFLVQRTGAIAFDPIVFSGLHGGQSRSITPTWEGQSNEAIQRHLDGGWMPIPVITHRQGDATVEQRTFVAPIGVPEATDKAAWYHDKPICVAEYAFTGGSADAPVAVNFECAAKEAVALREHVRGVVFEIANEFCALLDTTEAGPLHATIRGNTIGLSGMLPANATARMYLLIPGWQAAPEALPAPMDIPALLEATRAHWQSAMAGSTRITTPDPMLNNLILASRVHCMLAARNADGLRIAPWIASTHYGPLESEAHSLIRGMQYLGHEDFARRGLEFFIHKYNNDGYLTTGYTLIGTGWHLWALGEYFALTQNQEWLRANAPEINRVCQWILAQREKTMRWFPDGQRPPEHGLMPPGVLADWGVYSHYFYLDGNYYAGLRGAGQALSAINYDGACDILASAEAFRSDIQRAFAYVQGQAPVLQLRDGTWAPAYPTQLYSPMPIADMYVGDDVGRSWCYDVELGAHHLVPMGVLDPKDPGVDAMMNHMEDVQFLESGWFYYPKEGNHADWFNLGGFAKVQPYYARNAEVCALRDDVKPFIRTYFNSVASLLNREDLSLWEHFINGAFNKTHETGYFLHQTRLMFVQERDDVLWLAPFVPANWLESGQTVDVQDAPTAFGPVAYTITSHGEQDTITANIIPPQRQTPKEIVIRLRHPQGKPVNSVDVVGAVTSSVSPEDATVHITPAKEKITITATYSAIPG